jgi:hypothetical protein
MTLKEKFKKEKIYINPYDFKLTKEGVESFEKIADDYAIEFAEWAIDYSFNQMYSNDLKELLEEYKKEKGL